MVNIKDLVKDTTAKFTCYADGKLWYSIIEKNFEFYIPIEDTKGGVFNAEHKAINLMRWIRKYLELSKNTETTV